MKRAMCAVLITAILFPFGMAFGAGAVDIGEAYAVLLTDAASGTVIIEKNAYERIDPAGLVRLPALLTACHALDEGRADINAITSVSREAASIKGTTAFLSEGEQIKLSELLKAAVIINAGDALYALLQGIYGSDPAILSAEGECMTELGLPSPSDVMGKSEKYSLFELSKMCTALAESPSFLRYSSVYTETLLHERSGETELTNPNRLVRFYSGCFGLATGSEGASNYCGAFIAKRGSSTFLAIVAGAQNSSSRFRLASDLLDHAFANYRHFDIAKGGEIMGSVPVVGGISQSVDAVTSSDIDLLVPVNCKKLISEVALPEFKEAPIEKGESIGELIIKNSEGETVAMTPLVASESVEKANYFDWFTRLLNSWLSPFKAGRRD